MPKIVSEVLVGGVDKIKIITSTGNMNAQGANIRILTQAGKPFYIWPSLTVPAGKKLIGADFSLAPIATDDDVENQSLADAFVASNIDPDYINPETGQPILVWGDI